MAVQQTEKIIYGPGRVFITPAGSTQRNKYGDVNEFNMDIKVDQKDIYGENGFALAVFDGRKQIDLSVKHYTLRLDALASDLNQSAPGASTTNFIVDEKVTVPTTPYQYTLAQGATYVAGSIDLVMLVTTGGVTYPVTYAIVSAGSEVAGKSASITSAGVITFNAGDTGIIGKATYQYGFTLGSSMSLVNQYQNSTPSYQMVYVKRDKSPIDSSVGTMIVTLNAVRFGGLKFAGKEGSETLWERTLKAFADPTGAIGSIQFCNV